MFNTSQGHRIYNRMEKALLRERIHSKRKELASVDQQLLKIHLAASSSMNKETWDNFDRISFSSMERRYDINNNRQKKKFSNLSPVMEILDTSDTVINLSNYDLTSSQTSILAKGGNFAITPETIQAEDIIAGIESAIRRLPESQAEEIRTDTSRILRTAKPPTRNITRSEQRALQDLNSNENILILPADKGNATVIMNSSEYREKIRNLLDDTTYRKLDKDPTAKFLRQINSMVRNSSIPVDVRKTICVTEAVPPRLYGLPKIHKEGVPLRPIVSAIGSPTYHVSRYLASLLKPHIGQTETFIKDSAHFILKIKDITLEPGDLLVSFDVVSLFTKVPVQESLDLIAELFRDDITGIFRMCLTSSYFIWDKDIYEQIDGVAMGSPLSPVIANFYMERFEQRALESTNLRPKTWFRYVDDTFVVWNHGREELFHFQQHLNSINSNIQFTMETEKDGTLPFLDVLVKREGRSLGHTVYRKPSHTDRYLNRYSNHHPCQKRGLIKTMVDRARTICQPGDLKYEMEHLRGAFMKNGYSSKQFYRAARPSNNIMRTETETDTSSSNNKAFIPYIQGVTDKIGRLLCRHNIKTTYMPTKKVKECLRSAKDGQDPKASGGIYRIPCSCGEVYIGTTKRSVNTRIYEHKRHCNRLELEKSAVAEHAMHNPGHSILFESTDVISREQNYHHRIYREAIEIYKHNSSCFNKKEEGLKIRKSWYPVLDKCKIKRFPQPRPAPTIASRSPIQTPAGEKMGLQPSDQHRSTCSNNAPSPVHMPTPPIDMIGPAICQSAEDLPASDQSGRSNLGEPRYITRSISRRAHRRTPASRDTPKS